MALKKILEDTVLFQSMGWGASEVSVNEMWSVTTHSQKALL